MNDTMAPTPDTPTFGGHEALQLDIAETITALLTLAQRVADLADSHQRGLGFLTFNARQDENAMIRKERRLRLEAQILGQPAGHGATAAPGNLAAISAYVEIWTAARHQVRRLNRWHAKHGITPSPIREAAGAVYLLRLIRPLVWDTTEEKVLHAVHDDLAHVRDITERVVDGNDRVLLDQPCPHCGHKTLVVTFKDKTIVCDKDHATGERGICQCTNSLCECQKRPIAHRHTWYRDRGNKPDGWLTLARLLEADRRNPKGTHR